jgi:SanA protein
MHKTLQITLKIIISLLILLPLLIYFGISIWVHKDIYDDPDRIPAMEYALILGTSERVAGGEKNIYFHKRIEAAAELYHKGKVSRLIVSGDNREIYYNEPVAMKRALVELGVDKDSIVLDYAGLRTFDSMVRAKTVFGIDSFIVVSQKFHIERALYIAMHKNINAIGYTAKSPKKYPILNRTIFREIFARVRSVLDIHFLDTNPIFPE